jgi:hypothetical protein
MTDTPETPPVDEFDDAFTKFSASELPVLTPAPVEAPTEEETPPAVAEGAEETPVDEAPEEVPEEKPTAKHDTALLSKLEELLDKNRAAEQAPAPVQTPAPAPQVNPYTPEEQTFLAEYEKDWGDVSKAESLKRRTEYNDLVQYVFNEVAAVLRPMTQDLQVVLQERQKAQVLGAVPEYGTLQESITAWVGAQPAYLRDAYQRVIQGGNSDEIADLVERYKKDTSGSVVVDSSKQQATELPPPAKKAAQALAPVSSKRSSVVAAEPDKNDFDGAFAKFAAIT